MSKVITKQPVGATPPAPSTFDADRAQPPLIERAVRHYTGSRVHLQYSPMPGGVESRMDQLRTVLHGVRAVAEVLEADYTDVSSQEWDEAPDGMPLTPNTRDSLMRLQVWLASEATGLIDTVARTLSNEVQQ